MARPWRIQYAGAVYHLTARGNNKQDIFLDKEDRGFFLNCLARAWKRFDLEILAFCLMSNHYHLFLRTRKANLSKALHWLNATYTGHFNWRHQRCGHLFQGRYKSVLVLDQAHYLRLSMYIHLNPVRAGLVEEPEDYFWSSARDYMRLRDRFAWLNRDELLAHYGAVKLTQTRNYRRECRELIGQTPEFVERLKSAAILGPAVAAAEILEKHRPGGNAKEVPQYLAAYPRQVHPEQELQRVAAVFEVRPEDLKRKRRNFPARFAAYYHLVETCGLSVTETARILKIGTAAVSFGLRNFLSRLSEDPSLRQKMNRLKKMLTINSRPDPISEVIEINKG